MKPATFGPKPGSPQVLPEPDLLPHSSMPSGFMEGQNPAELPPSGQHPTGHAHQDIDQNLPPEIAAQLAKLPQGFFKKMGSDSSLPDVQQPSSLPTSLPSHHGEFPADLPPEVAAQLAKLPPGFFSRMKNEQANTGVQPSSVTGTLPGHVSQGYHMPGPFPHGQVHPGQIHPGQMPQGQNPGQMNQISASQIPDVAAMSLEGNRGNTIPGSPAAPANPSVPQQNLQQVVRADSTCTVSSVVTPVPSVVNDQSSHQHGVPGAGNRMYSSQSKEQMLPHQYQQSQQQQLPQVQVSAYQTPYSAGSQFQQGQATPGFSQTQQPCVGVMQNHSQAEPYGQQPNQSRNIPGGSNVATAGGSGYYNRQSAPTQYGYPQQTGPSSQYSSVPTSYQQQPFQQTQTSTGQANQYPTVSQSARIPPVSQPSQPRPQNYYAQNTNDSQQPYPQNAVAGQQYAGYPQGPLQQVQPSGQIQNLQPGFSQSAVASASTSQYGQYVGETAEAGYPNTSQQMSNQNCSQIPSHQVYQVGQRIGQVQIQPGQAPQTGGVKPQVPLNQNVPMPNQSVPVPNQNVPMPNQNVPMSNQSVQIPNQNVLMSNRNVPYSQSSQWQGQVASQASAGPVQNPQMYNSTAYIQTSVNLPAPFSQGQAVSSSNYQQQYQGSQQYAGNVPGYQQKNVVQPGTSQASGYYQQTPNQAFQSKPGVVGSGPIPQSQIPSSQYQQPTPNQGCVAQQNIGPGSGQGQGQGQYSQPPRVMTPQGQSLPSQVQPAGQAPLSYQQALQPVSSQQSANTPVPFSSQYPQQIPGVQTVGGLQPQQQQQQVLGGLQPQQTVGGPQQFQQPGLQQQQTVGLQPQQIVGGLQPQQTSGLPPQQTAGLPPHQTAGLQPLQNVGGQQQPIMPQKPLTPDSYQPTIPPKSQPSGTYSLSRQGSSLDELLSSSPDNTNDSSIPAPQIAPKVLTAQEIQQQKEEARKNKEFFESPKDPYPSGTPLNQFVTAVEAFGKTVDELGVTNVFGQTKLDLLWKVRHF